MALPPSVSHDHTPLTLGSKMKLKYLVFYKKIKWNNIEIVSIFKCVFEVLCWIKINSRTCKKKHS